MKKSEAVKSQTTELFSFQRFSFHGVTVEVKTDCPLVSSSLARDFSYFLEAPSHAATDSDIKLTCQLEDYPAGTLPELITSDIEPRRTLYRSGSTHWISYYQGEALSIWNSRSEQGEIWSRTPELLYELAYLFILSRTGEALDRLGVHRLHASGISINGEATLIVMPSGGGKTTLLLAAMSLPEAHFISDDMPLITRSGQVLPFPSRLGLRDPKLADVSESSMRSVKRRDYGEKWLTDADIYASRISKEARPKRLLFGQRKTKGRCEIIRVGRWWSLKQLGKGLVIGVGIPQVIEYFLRLGARDVLAKGSILCSRTVAATVLVFRSENYRIELGPDLDNNIEVLTKFLET